MGLIEQEKEIEMGETAARKAESATAYVELLKKDDRRNSTPFDLAKQTIDDLYDEAKTWLDGDTVETQEQADTIAKLLDMARKAQKDADTARKKENKPFDDGKAEVQARYKPILSKADLITNACKAAVTPFLAAQEAKKREAERIAREEAEAAERAAQEAMSKSSVADIEQREEAEKLVEAAKQASANAAKLAKDKGQAKGGARAMSLRTTYRAELTDANAAVKHFWATDKEAFVELVQRLADKAVLAGEREIPGFKIITEQKAV